MLYYGLREFLSYCATVPALRRRTSLLLQPIPCPAASQRHTISLRLGFAPPVALAHPLRPRATGRDRRALATASARLRLRCTCNRDSRTVVVWYLIHPYITTPRTRQEETERVACTPVGNRIFCNFTVTDTDTASLNLISAAH